MQYTLFPLNDVVCLYGGHEGQTPSIFWLKKAFDRVRYDPLCFSREDACINMGMTRTMMRSMVYWAEAFKIIECWDSSAKAYQVTEFGTALLDQETGADPYLESTQTLWILHWNLLKTPCLPKVWQGGFIVVVGKVKSAETSLNICKMLLHWRRSN